MVEETRIAIVGYGNIGRGVHQRIIENQKLHHDVRFAGIITRRPQEVEEELLAKDLVGTFVVSTKSPKEWFKLGADVAILCGGSKNDLPVQGPKFARHFNTVDSFDTHAHIKPYLDKVTKEHREGYFADMDVSARGTEHTAAISIGWDPGTFSLERVLAEAYIPGAKPYGFYGLSEKGGLSMGHSDAIRQIKGVKDARQYTHAFSGSIERLRRGENPDLKPGEMHWRECFVVLEKNTPEERRRVYQEIRTMPDYFEPYRTEVKFVSQEELDKEHSDMSHDGLVIAVGKNGEVTEYKNTWPNNPLGTAGIMVATARAVHRMNKEGQIGAYRSIDIPASCLSPRSDEYLTKESM